MAILTFTWPSQSVSIPGAATEVTLQSVLTEVTSIDNKTPSLVSGRVPVDGSGVVQPVSGPLTDAQLRATAVPVSGPLTDTQLRASAVPVSVASLPLPTGAATETTLDAVKTSVQIIDDVVATDSTTAPTKAVMIAGHIPGGNANIVHVSAGGAVKVDGSGVTQPISATDLDIRDLSSATDSVTVVASNLDIRDLTSASDSVAAVQSGTWNINNISGTISLPTGAATETTLSALNTKVPANLTVSSTRLLVDGSGVTQPVSLASAPAATGRSSVQILRNDYSSVNVTTGAYVQLTASTSGTINKLQIFDSSGSVLVLATGAAAAEVDRIYIFPGGNGDVELNIPFGTRLSIKAVDANATVGQLLINALS